MNLLVQICSNTKDLYKKLYENKNHMKNFVKEKRIKR